MLIILRYGTKHAMGAAPFNVTLTVTTRHMTFPFLLLWVTFSSFLAKEFVAFITAVYSLSVLFQAFYLDTSMPWRLQTTADKTLWKSEIGRTQWGQLKNKLDPIVSLKRHVPCRFCFVLFCFLREKWPKWPKLIFDPISAIEGLKLLHIL